MKILVTGGAGFIGSHTVVELCGAGYDVVILDNFSNSDEAVLQRLGQILGKAPAWYYADCADAQILEKIMRLEQIEGVIHFAALKAVGDSVAQPLEYYRNNLVSTLTLLEVMQRCAVRYLVFSSSCTVYGQPDTIPVSESMPRLPATSPYGNTKVICEDMIRDAVASGAGLKAISLRYFNPIGAHSSGLIGELPNGTPSNLVPFLTQTAAGIREKLVVFGDDYDTPDGSCIRDFIHVADLAKAHIAALDFLTRSGGTGYYDVVNAGTGTGHTVLELIRLFEEVNGLKLPYAIGPRRAGDIGKIYGDVGKAHKLLNWTAEKTIAESLRDAWRWQQQLSS